MSMLSSWPQIDKDIETFQKLMKHDEDALAELDKVIASKSPTTEVAAKTGTHSDPTARVALSIIEHKAQLERSTGALRAKIAELEHTRQAVETAVSQLHHRDADMIRRFYFNQEHWESIAVSMHLSRSRFYEILERARSKVEWWLHQDDDRD